MLVVLLDIEGADNVRSQCPLLFFFFFFVALQDGQVESFGAFTKMKSFFIHAIDYWGAEF